MANLLWDNAPVITVQEMKYFQDEWHDLYGDRIAKGGELFGVYRFDDFRDDGSFDQ